MKNKRDSQGMYGMLPGPPNLICPAFNAGGYNPVAHVEEPVYHHSEQSDSRQHNTDSIDRKVRSYVSGDPRAPSSRVTRGDVCTPGTTESVNFGKFSNLYG